MHLGNIATYEGQTVSYCLYCIAFDPVKPTETSTGLLAPPLPFISPLFLSPHQSAYPGDRDHSFADWPYLLNFLLAVSAFLSAGLADCKQMWSSVCGLECPVLKGNRVIILGFRTEELVLNQSS